VVDLDAFSLEGKAGKDRRYIVNRLEKEGVRFERHDPPLADRVLLELKDVSDEWLQIPGRRERRFTLGLFDPDYVRSTPVILAMDAGGRILGFLNLIPSYHPAESTIDLMRRRTEAPNGLMDYLFIRAFDDAKARGFHRFNLGMAPMSGFREREEAGPEERAVHLFVQNLNFLFSYRGLRAYKAKFATSWEPRYTIYRHVLDLPLMAIALTGVSELRD
jgi:phosphatidylglycerol lysyltransferase